jgi:hypothetical protein
MSQHRGRNRSCRWLCPLYSVLQSAKEVRESHGDNHRRIHLVCTHSRPEMLPSKPGCVSIERMRSWNTSQLAALSWTARQLRNGVVGSGKVRSMMTTTYSNRFQDLTGRTLNDLYIVQIAGRNPVRWLVQCDRCSASWNELRTTLINGAKRRNSPCQKGCLLFLLISGVVSGAVHIPQCRVPPSLFPSSVRMTSQDGDPRNTSVQTM